MPNLSDSIDRLLYTSQSIKSTAASIASTPSSSSSSNSGPFARALLHTHLGDLIRDVDSSEIGLFNLVPPTRQIAQDGDKGADKGVGIGQSGLVGGEITRVEFHGATPLRRGGAAGRGGDPSKVKEVEPEVYASATLKYLDRYNTIRPMPRARAQVIAMLEDLASVREDIETYTDRLDSLNHQQADDLDGEPPPSPKSMAVEEERRIQELQVRINELKKQKEALLKKPTRPRSRFTKPPTKPAPKPVVDVSVQEEVFWNTPAAKARTLQFTAEAQSQELLLDADDGLMGELGDVSVGFASPLPAGGNQIRKGLGFGLGAGRRDLRDVAKAREVDQGSPPVRDSQGSQDKPEVTHLVHDSDELPDAPSTTSEADETVVLSKPPIPSIQRVPMPLPPSPPRSVQTPVQPKRSPDRTKTVKESAKKPRLKVTTEMERIVTKMWSSVGEIIMPGNTFDVSSGGGNRPPRAKDTMYAFGLYCRCTQPNHIFRSSAYLDTLCSQVLSPPSPSTSSVSSLAPPVLPSTPTTHQLLTSLLLLTLLTSPTLSMEINALKEVLASRLKQSGDGEEDGMGAQASQRALYGCVAKRLVRIERGKGEQIVKFVDV
ncbi:hypothetical protein JAAARDRAFT_35427 [Jaapia argillacea MUCL 33604]|uniref:Uncharacterized protein n=1 Tax=Jaapia argillacea MUCL 33604 TaxID=933084 RepID=A0A067Q2M2_9AGAM|nr:hypothetical protein JAAARDRAFT_35427 [Jaapia argillacea MUCL 33604]